jgi:ribosomal protein S18 acetylase RimI-like enzyme
VEFARTINTIGSNLWTIGDIRRLGTKCHPKLRRRLWTDECVGMTMEITVKRVRKGDDLSLVKRALEEVDRRVVEQGSIESFLADVDNYLFIATDGHDPVGTLSGYSLVKPFRHAREYFLYEIGVIVNRRKLGIGRMLVNAFIDSARLAGASEIWVLTDRSNVAAVSLYQSCGMQLPKNDDGIVMIRKMA